MKNLSDNIKTVVLVMMENRSFDHMLGHLKLEDPEADINGLSKPLDQYINPYLGNCYSPYNMPHDVELPGDVPHECEYVKTQLAYNEVNERYMMNGFVAAYAKFPGTGVNPECIPMGYLISGQVPVTDFLAKHFCTCDNWFCPLPTSTQPNRTMAFSGDSTIYQTRTKLIDIPHSIFDWLKANQIRWRVYHDGLPFFTLYPELWPYVLSPHFRRYENLYDDMLHEPIDHTPQVIIIEPNYEDAPHLGSKQPNDNHAPLAIGWGEYFLRRTYQAITANEEKWKHTAMILYYDEHGGFYDHQPPPKIPYTTIGEEPHSFNSLGPRIPGIVISPYIKPGTVSHDLFDHTSVLQFLAGLFTPGKPYPGSVDERRMAGIQ